MAGDFNKPVVTDAYASVLQSIKDLISDLAKGLDGTSTANIPTNAIRWSSANNRFEKYNGSSWGALASTFAMNVASVAGKIPGLAAGNLLYLDGNAKVPLANMYRGAGSGLDADSVDGIDSSRFVYGDNTTATKLITSANAITGSGFYNGVSVTGFPDSSWWHMIQGRHTDEGSDYRFQLAFNFDTDDVKFRRFAGAKGVAGNAWRTIVHSGNAPGAFNAQAAGTYGGMNITGANGGWAGFQFNSTSRYFMSSSGQTGEYDTSAGAWQWRWDNGTLVVGTVPWARLSGIPAMSFLELTGGTLSGGLTVPSLTISSNSNHIIMSDTDWGNKYIHANSGLIGFLNSSGNWELYTNNSGQVWTSNYGWLHDYFFNNVANCGGQGTGSPAINCYGSGAGITGYRHELIDNDGQIQIRTVNYLGNCNCNCNCTCFPAGSKVLMFDKSWRDIETIVIGELLMGADGKPAEVVKLDITILGERQMYTFDDGHTWSEEHLHWTRRDGAEWWWSANPDQWRYEVQIGEVVGLRDNMSVRSGEDVEFAHLEGFVKRTPTRVQYDPSTPLFLPVTRGIPIIVDGYVVGAGSDEFIYDYSQFNWNPREIV